jgi:succinyl-diaminopimelate desuccinylase
MSSEHEQISELTKRLVEIPSITGRRAESQQVLDLVNEYLRNENVVYQQFESNGIVSGIWGSPDTLLKPKLLLSGHIDVVEANPEQFNPVEKNGKIFARGAGDMKGHVAAMMMAYKKFVEENKSSKDISLLLTSDEEVGGFNGTRFVIEKQNLRPALVFIPDGEFSFDIVDSQKAPHHFHVKAVSKDGGGHVSKAFKLDNPVNRILNVYVEMRKKYAVASIDDEWKSTFEMTVFKTGNGDKSKGQEENINSANQIPEWADAWFGWRWPLEVKIDGKKATYKSGLADLQKIARKNGVMILKDDHGKGEGCYSDPNAKFIQTWKGIIQPIVGHEVGFKHMHGSTDGRHFYTFGSEVLVTSGVTEGAHSSNEWVDIDSLVELSEAIYKYQKEMTK